MSGVRFPGIYPLFAEEFNKYSTVWIISDTHFGDEDLRKAYPNRPTDEELVKKINSKAGKGSLIIFLGDVGTASYLTKLRADCWLVLGNHDKGVSEYAKFINPKFIFTGPVVIGEKLILSHEPIEGINWAYNIHGHNHNPGKNDENHYNCCLDACAYEPLNFNQFLKSGKTAHIKSLHRDIIDTATIRKQKRNNFIYNSIIPKKI